jgi:hypothetical protein
MHEKMDNFVHQLRVKLDAADQRIKALKASAKTTTEKAKIDAKAQLAALEAHAKEQQSRLQSAQAKTKAWVDQKKMATSEKIAAWKQKHEVDKLVSHANHADDYAVASMQLAIVAVDEAERAALEAVVARIDANYAQAAPAKSA